MKTHFPHFLENQKNESTSGKPGKDHVILQKITKILEKIPETWKKYFIEGKKWLAIVIIIRII